MSVKVMLIWAPMLAPARIRKRVRMLYYLGKHSIIELTLVFL